MKLLFLGKRHPMGRDLITRPYGRFFYLPYYLAERGHEVHTLLLDYHDSGSLDVQEHGIHWISESLRFGRPLQYLNRLRELISAVRPDWVIGLSDTYYGILAEYYGHEYGARVCIDAYDNYQSYIPWMKPLHLAWRRALSRSDLITAAGPALLDFLSGDRLHGTGCVVPMAADPTGFAPMDRSQSRQVMGLPAGQRLIGYCGSLHKSRGMTVLFEAFAQLHQRHPDTCLVLSGRQAANVQLPEQAISLGYVDDEKMPVLLNCLDVLAVINQPSAFGNHSYPVKLYEAMSCGLPVAVTATQASQWILRDSTKYLVPPDDPAALCNCLEASMQLRQVHYPNVTDWESGCDDLEAALRDSGLPQADQQSG